MNKKSEKIIDALQWIIIILSLGFALYTAHQNHLMSESQEVRKENTYLKIYDSQTISALEMRNKQLEDSIKKLQDVESVVQFKYVTKYVTDTVFVEVDNDSEEDIVKKDSIYHYENNSDTIQYKLDIKADRLYWHKLDFTVNNEFSIVNREKDGKVETSIITGSGKVDDVNLWHRKNKTWKDRISIGPSIGIGYGIINNNVDIYVGGSISYDLF